MDFDEGFDPNSASSHDQDEGRPITVPQQEGDQHSEGGSHEEQATATIDHTPPIGDGIETENTSDEAASATGGTLPVTTTTTTNEDGPSHHPPHSHEDLPPPSVNSADNHIGGGGASLMGSSSSASMPATVIRGGGGGESGGPAALSLPPPPTVANSEARASAMGSRGGGGGASASGRNVPPSSSVGRVHQHEGAPVAGSVHRFYPAVGERGASLEECDVRAAGGGGGGCVLRQAGASDNSTVNRGILRGDIASARNQNQNREHHHQPPPHVGIAAVGAVEEYNRRLKRYIRDHNDRERRADVAAARGYLARDEWDAMREQIDVSRYAAVAQHQQQQQQQKLFRTSVHHNTNNQNNNYDASAGNRRRLSAEDADQQGAGGGSALASRAPLRAPRDLGGEGGGDDNGLMAAYHYFDNEADDAAARTVALAVEASATAAAVALASTTSVAPLHIGPFVKRTAIRDVDNREYMYNIAAAVDDAQKEKQYKSKVGVPISVRDHAAMGRGRFGYILPSQRPDWFRDTYMNKYGGGRDSGLDDRGEGGAAALLGNGWDSNDFENLPTSSSSSSSEEDAEEGGVRRKSLLSSAASSASLKRSERAARAASKRKSSASFSSRPSSKASTTKGEESSIYCCPDAKKKGTFCYNPIDWCCAFWTNLCCFGNTICCFCGCIPLAGDISHGGCRSPLLYAVAVALSIIWIIGTNGNLLTIATNATDESNVDTSLRAPWYELICFVFPFMTLFTTVSGSGWFAWLVGVCGASISVFIANKELYSDENHDWYRTMFTHLCFGLALLQMTFVGMIGVMMFGKYFKCWYVDFIQCFTGSLDGEDEALQRFLYSRRLINWRPPLSVDHWKAKHQRETLDPSRYNRFGVAKRLLNFIIDVPVSFLKMPVKMEWNLPPQSPDDDTRPLDTMPTAYSIGLGITALLVITSLNLLYLLLDKYQTEIEKALRDALNTSGDDETNHFYTTFQRYYTAFKISSIVVCGLIMFTVLFLQLNGIFTNLRNVRKGGCNGSEMDDQRRKNEQLQDAGPHRMLDGIATMFFTFCIFIALAGVLGPLLVMFVIFLLMAPSSFAWAIVKGLGTTIAQFIYRNFVLLVLQWVFFSRFLMDAHNIRHPRLFSWTAPVIMILQLGVSFVRIVGQFLSSLTSIPMMFVLPFSNPKSPLYSPLLSIVFLHDNSNNALKSTFAAYWIARSQVQRVVFLAENYGFGCRSFEVVANKLDPRHEGTVKALYHGTGFVNGGDIRMPQIGGGGSSAAPSALSRQQQQSNTATAIVNYANPRDAVATTNPNFTAAASAAAAHVPPSSSSRQQQRQPQPSSASLYSPPRSARDMNAGDDDGDDNDAAAAALPLLLHSAANNTANASSSSAVEDGANATISAPVEHLLQFPPKSDANDFLDVRAANSNPYSLANTDLLHVGGGVGGGAADNNSDDYHNVRNSNRFFGGGGGHHANGGGSTNNNSNNNTLYVSLATFGAGEMYVMNKHLVRLWVLYDHFPQRFPKSKTPAASLHPSLERVVLDEIHAYVTWVCEGKRKFAQLAAELKREEEVKAGDGAFLCSATSTINPDIRRLWEGCEDVCDDDVGGDDDARSATDSNKKQKSAPAPPSTNVFGKRAYKKAVIQAILASHGLIVTPTAYDKMYSVAKIRARERELEQQREEALMRQRRQQDECSSSGGGGGQQLPSPLLAHAVLDLGEVTSPRPYCFLTEVVAMHPQHGRTKGHHGNHHHNQHHDDNPRDHDDDGSDDGEGGEGGQQSTSLAPSRASSANNRRMRRGGMANADAVRQQPGTVSGGEQRRSAGTDVDVNDVGASPQDSVHLSPVVTVGGGGGFATDDASAPLLLGGGDSVASSSVRRGGDDDAVAINRHSGGNSAGYGGAAITMATGNPHRNGTATLLPAPATAPMTASRAAELQGQQFHQRQALKRQRRSAERRAEAIATLYETAVFAYYSLLEEQHERRLAHLVLEERAKKAWLIHALEHPEEVLVPIPIYGGGIAHHNAANNNDNHHDDHDDRRLVNGERRLHTPGTVLSSSFVASIRPDSMQALARTRASWRWRLAMTLLLYPRLRRERKQYLRRNGFTPAEPLTFDPTGL